MDFPTTYQASLLFNEQLSDWDCWLVSLRVALKYLGKDTTYQELLLQLKGTGLKISPTHGAFFPYTAVIGAKLGLRSSLACPLSMLPELVPLLYQGGGVRPLLTKTHLLEVAAQCRVDMFPRYYLYLCLASLMHTPVWEKFKIGEKAGTPSIIDVRDCLARGEPVLVNVTCDEYYGLREDQANHVLALLPVSDAYEGYVVFDSYAKLGFKHYDNWDLCLQKANRYDWTKWSNWMLALAID